MRVAAALTLVVAMTCCAVPTSAQQQRDAKPGADMAP